MVAKLRVAVVGYGNVGKSAVAAVQLTPDMEVAGVVRRRAVRPPGLSADIPITEDVGELTGVDVAVLTVPSRIAPDYAQRCLPAGVSTVDSFDLHGDEIWRHVREMGRMAEQGRACAVVAAGWDPGTDSMVRALMELVISRGVTYTTFGPGMSLGHSVVCREIAGVRDAVSFTVPAGDGVHRREVYVELEEGASLEDISDQIRQDPYFAGDETSVTAVDDVTGVTDLGHGVSVQRRGASADAHNTLSRFEMRGTNPAMTAEVMVSAARAASRMEPGAYTLPEIPLFKMLPGEREELVKRLV
ncbi:MAG: diaminopimelate dehydrogenase [Bacillota bacterium]